MDGRQLLERLREVLNEDATSGFVDDKNSYWYLWEAARDFVSRTNILTDTQSITTVADQDSYTLNADFAELYLRDVDQDFIIKYNDGSNNTFPFWKDYNKVIYEDNTTSVSIPANFTVKDDNTLDSQVTGTTTSAGVLSAGEATLTDTTADFSDVSAGDIVHNTTDGSDGIVLSKTSSIVLVTALFGGTDNDYTSGDIYVIQPQSRMQMILNPPPSTAGHTITLYYIKYPAPVFSDYGMYQIPSNYMTTLAKYAAWLYKYRDSEPDFGDAWYQFYDREVRKANRSLSNTLNKNTLKVSFRSRNNGR